MTKEIAPSSGLKGQIEVPPDKSITHRAILISSIAMGKSIIKNPLEAADCLSSLDCVQKLGCSVLKEKGHWTVTGYGLRGYQKPKVPLDCGNSGTTMRLLAGLLAAQNFETELVGDTSLSRRPMTRVAVPLSQMGARVDLTNGQNPPMRILGTKELKVIQWVNPLSSAQVKSAILLAALHIRGTSSYSEPQISRNHTERMLKAAGAVLTGSGKTLFVEGPANLKPMTWIVPGDFSSAAFFIVGGLIIKGSDINLKKVNLNPTRTGLLKVLDKTGVKIEIDNKKVVGGEPVGDLHIVSWDKLKAFTLDKSIVPSLIDEIPILAVFATQAKGTSKFQGIGELRVKETDRIKAIVTNLSAMGAEIKEEKDGFIIKGPTKLKGADLSSYNDHRIAMAFAIAGLAASGPTQINNHKAVAISYPSFWESLNRLNKGS